ncbi:MAG: c-type cytochrome [Gammaproteobacteria bacterium]|nr:c-type cytochrome [Gammaproteobacteria bacterium]NIM74448.1 c-type cytochrome [Gammaproteobacteria bacterium]NIN37425.1 c-type cytochrome [Gammaproteobacteria bacterium]NIO26281.1 c-type cytochrome [Gammaproteobacteria bacterium]NIO66833.1 c-type cytochrome [Gammaproteobacteria bacterium]
MRTLLIATVTALALVQPTAQAAGDAQAGKAKSASCAACHGPEGKRPTTPAFPILAGQYADYLVRALEDYKTGKRKNPIMAGLAAGLSAQDREDLAAFYASQESDLYTVEYSKELQ